MYSQVREFKRVTIRLWKVRDALLPFKHPGSTVTIGEYPCFRFSSKSLTDGGSELRKALFRRIDEQATRNPRCKRYSVSATVQIPNRFAPPKSKIIFRSSTGTPIERVTISTHAAVQPFRVTCLRASNLILGAGITSRITSFAPKGFLINRSRNLARNMVNWIVIPLLSNFFGYFPINRYDASPKSYSSNNYN